MKETPDKPTYWNYTEPIKTNLFRLFFVLLCMIKYSFDFTDLGICQFLQNSIFSPENKFWEKPYQLRRRDIHF